MLKAIRTRQELRRYECSVTSDVMVSRHMAESGQDFVSILYAGYVMLYYTCNTCDRII